jgi:hypothetical protein
MAVTVSSIAAQPRPLLADEEIPHEGDVDRLADRHHLQSGDHLVEHLNRAGARDAAAVSDEA